MRWIRRLLVLQLLLLVLAGLLLWFAPAALAYRQLADRLGPLRLDDVGGSVWEGRARQLVAYDVALGTLRWRLSPWSLLARRPSGELELAGEAIDARARFRFEDGALDLSEVDARFPAALLGPALDIPALRLTGTVTLRARHARLVGGLLASADGEADWRDLGVAGAAQGRLPGIRMRFRPDEAGGTLAEVTDLGGPVAITGSTRLANGRFVSETTFELREPNVQLAQVLAHVGQRTPSGGSYLRIEGELHRLGGPSR